MNYIPKFAYEQTALHLYYKLFPSNFQFLSQKLFGFQEAESLNVNMAPRYRPLAILPAMISLATFLLTLIPLMAGSSKGVLEDYAIVNLNVSSVGQNLVSFSPVNSTSPNRRNINSIPTLASTFLFSSPTSSGMPSETPLCIVLTILLTGSKATDPISSKL